LARRTASFPRKQGSSFVAPASFPQMPREHQRYEAWLPLNFANISVRGSADPFSGSAAFRSLSPKNSRPWQAGLRYTCWRKNASTRGCHPEESAVLIGGRRRISAVRLQNRPVSLGKELQRSFARQKAWRAQDDRRPNLNDSGKQFFNSRHRQEQPFGCLGKFDEAVLPIECCCAVIFCVHNNHSRGDLFASTQATVKRIHQ